MPKKMFTARDLRARRSKYSRAMKKLLKNPKIAEVLNRDEERERFFQGMKKHSAGDGITVDEMRMVLGELKRNAGDDIDQKEVRLLARELIKYGPKYKYPKKERKGARRSESSGGGGFLGLFSGGGGRSGNASRDVKDQPSRLGARGEAARSARAYTRNYLRGKGFNSSVSNRSSLPSRGSVFPALSPKSSIYRNTSRLSFRGGLSRIKRK